MPQVPFDMETGLPQGWNPWADTDGVFKELYDMARLVFGEGACSLPGSTIKYDPFVQIARYAVHRGTVDVDVAERVLTWLRWGTDAGVQRDRLRGVRVFSNYETALGEFSGRVSKALTKRVRASKSIDLGDWQEGWRGVARDVFTDFFVAPMLAVPKPLEPTECRPATDHTATTLNDATDDTGLRHELQGHREISHFLQCGFVMTCADVDSAFPMLALAPWPCGLSSPYAFAWVSYVMASGGRSVGIDCSYISLPTLARAVCQVSSSCSSRMFFSGWHGA